MTEGFNGFCYVYEGSGTIGGSEATPQSAMVMGPGQCLCSTLMQIRFDWWKCS